MVKRSLLLSLLFLLFGGVVRAQIPTLDALPPCNFGDLAPSDDITIGAVVLDFETGRGCTENLDQTFPVASVPKLFVSGAHLREIYNGRMGFDGTRLFNEFYWMGDDDECLLQDDMGRDVTIGELGNIMIACSDNAATWMLMDGIGWETVQFYMDEWGVQNAGEVIPYAFVDRLKLEFLDPRWANVPPAMASRYYRARMTDGLDVYFSTLPAYTREERQWANQQYFDTYDYNTATPRTIANYILTLRNDLFSEDDERRTTAFWLLSTMLLTQRQYSAQAIPGDVLVGAKNGFDFGMTAEVNVMFNDPESLIPSSMSILFTQQADLLAEDVQRPGQVDGVLNTYLRDLSPSVAELLYPGHIKPPIYVDPAVSSAVVNTGDTLAPCWEPYSTSAFEEIEVEYVETCWVLTGSAQFVPVDTLLGLGLTLRGLDSETVRLAFVFTAPSGEKRSYQTERFFVDNTSVYWFHPVQELGSWTVDVYLNTARVHTQTVQVS